MKRAIAILAVAAMMALTASPAFAQTDSDFCSEGGATASAFSSGDSATATVSCDDGSSASASTTFDGFSFDPFDLFDSPFFVEFFG